MNHTNSQNEISEPVIPLFPSYNSIIHPLFSFTIANSLHFCSSFQWKKSSPIPLLSTALSPWIPMLWSQNRRNRSVLRLLISSEVSLLRYFSFLCYSAPFFVSFYYFDGLLDDARGFSSGSICFCD